jgi:hypothetical protein
MRMGPKSSALGFVFGSLLIVLAGGAEPAKAKEKPQLYDPKADGKQQIEQAVTQARQEGKNILLKFGANW